ncbi:MAG: DUF86 domain-containing protein [Oscillospiraceae bacterium]|nr:DUF86 domain-containing protein [Oscillospiraceae bacterium]
MAKSNAQLLKHMLEYISQIQEAGNMFNADLNELKENSVYRNAVALCVLQIGELANNLTEDFRNATSQQIPWKAVRGLRNIVAHHYGKIDYESLWETIECDIPVLKEFCEKQLSDSADEKETGENL